MLNDLRNAVQKVWLRQARAVIEDDKGSIHILSPLHITRIRSQPSQTSP